MTNETQRYQKPLPEITSQSAPFWMAAHKHQLVLQQCTNCHRYQYPPIDLCPVCAGEFAWVPASGRGQVHTFIIMHQLYHPAFKGELPYNVSVIELAEGPLMISNLVHCRNEDIRIGMPVRVVFEDVTPEEVLPKFEPA